MLIMPHDDLNLILTLPVPILDEEKKLNFLFSHFFVVPKKVF